MYQTLKEYEFIDRTRSSWLILKSLGRQCIKICTKIQLHKKYRKMKNMQSMATCYGKKRRKCKPYILSSMASHSGGNTPKGPTNHNVQNLALCGLPRSFLKLLNLLRYRLGSNPLASHLWGHHLTCWEERFAFWSGHRLYRPASSYGWGGNRISDTSASAWSHLIHVPCGCC